MTLPMNRRQAIKTLALAGTAAASGSLGSGQAFAQQTTELSFWTWRQEDRSQYAQLFADFIKKNPDIKVNFQGYEAQNYGTVLSTALAAGKGPDVIHVRAYGGTEQFAKSGYLEPLSREAVPELANFSDEALLSNSLRADKKVYAVPFASQTLGLFTNQEVFDKHGLKAPTTWDELIQVSKTLKDKGVIPIANGMSTVWMVEVFTSVFAPAFHGKEFIEDVAAGKATFEDPRYVGALEKLLELRDYMPPGFGGIDYPTSQQLFLSGRAGMFAGGSFEIANFRRQNPSIKMEFHAPPAAKAGGPRYVSLFYDGGYAVNAKSEKKDAAMKLVRYMGTKEFGDKFSALLGNISPIKGVEISDPMLARVSQLNASSVPYVMAVYFRFQDPTGSTLLQQGIQKMMNGQATPAQVASDVTKGIATYHEPFKKG
ncbi:MAG TPA: extracellular solute-binding protein [Microvirga sp.]|jgi:raffinose/stachyose/melibiose transport system substrate-binding protein|nr:extracellular solute-binding protein [Microvirga sp.]